MIGSHAAKFLVKNDSVLVFGIVRPRSDVDGLIGILDKITLLVGDITDKTNIHTILDKVRPAHLYHFAAQSMNFLSYSLPELTHQTNVIGTRNILDSIVDLNLHNCRILLAGSSTEYGKSADRLEGPIHENFPFEPVSPYGQSKVNMEKLGIEFFKKYNLKIFTARYFIQIGVGGTNSLAIHQFCRQIAMTEVGLIDPILYHGNLDTKRDMTDARDSAPITVKLMENVIPGEPYNVASGVAFSMRKLLNIAIEMSSISIQLKVDREKLRPYDEKILLGDNDKIKKITGWDPQPDLHDSVENILNYWRRKIMHRYGMKDKTVKCE